MTSAPPPPTPQACSDAWAGLSAHGTATRASFWVALEQPGPWGRDALTDSHLDPALGAALGRAAGDAGGRVLLIRGPGQHADTAPGRPRRVYVAGGLAGAAWLLTGEVDDPAQVLGLPWADLGGDTPVALPWLRASAPVLLVCTNAKRDRCCALRGRPLAAALAGEGRAVWECSHTGGHRFAPTGVLLPWGQMLARLTPALGREVLDAAASSRFAAGALTPEHDRGVSHLVPAAQAAVSWVRAATAEVDPRALAVSGAGEAWVVRHRDGRTWRVSVRAREGDPAPDSCGKPATPTATWRVAPDAG